MKKGISIGISIVVAIVVILAVLWLVNNEGANNPQPQLPPTNVTMPIGHSYSLNLTESMGMKANP